MQSTLMLSLNYITKQFPGFQFDEFNEKTMLDWESPEIFIAETRNFLPVHMEKLGSFLSRDEIIRCLRFHSQKDRESFIVVHGLLRYFIGLYLDIHPSTVSLEYNRFGKPFLSGHYRSLFFNLSHSADISILAFDNKSSIGIDVEKIDPEIDFQSISKTFFTPKEYEYISPGEEGDLRRFYQLWTRKEALLKALGIGISQNLRYRSLPPETPASHRRAWTPENEDRELFAQDHDVPGKIYDHFGNDGRFRGTGNTPDGE